MQQSAIDANCNTEDFTCGKNVVTVSKENVFARKYLKLPYVCNLISYGNNIVATISEEYRDIVLFSTLDAPSIFALNDTVFV